MTVLKLESKKDKKGIKQPIIKDENGYYKVVLGEFNTFNRSGIYYEVPDPVKVLGPGTLVHRRIENGILIAENGHPDVSNIKDRAELSREVIKLRPENKIAHIKAIEIKNLGKVEPGFKYPVYRIYGWVKPEGPHKEILQEALENPDENVYFSIRSLVNQRRVGNIIIRTFILISTWDYVYEGGIANASQWNAAGVEDIDLTVDLDPASAEKLVSGFEGNCEDGKCVIDCIKCNLPKTTENIILNF